MNDNPQDGQEGFLTRWSRRKDASRKGEALPEPADDADSPPQDAADTAVDAPSAEVEAPDDEEVREPAEAELELPPLESLGEDSDYSAFMGDGVPQELRQQALKKLFHSPKFNIRDGLDDYDWDFTNPEPLGDIVTAEMRYRIERELERLAGLDDDEEKPEDAPAVAAVEAGEHDATDDRSDPEADDERSEPA